MTRKSLLSAGLAVGFMTVAAACERSTTVTSEQELRAVARTTVEAAGDTSLTDLVARERLVIDRIVERVPSHARQEVREFLNAEHTAVYAADSPELSALLDELYSVRALRVQRERIVLRNPQLPRSR